MEGCHVIIFISQNPNPNFLLSFHHHGSRRRHLLAGHHWNSPETAATPHRTFSVPQQQPIRTPPSSSIRAAVFYHHRSSAHHHHEPASARTFSAAPPSSRRHFLLPVSVQPLHAQHTSIFSRRTPPRAHSHEPATLLRNMRHHHLCTLRHHLPPRFASHTVARTCAAHTIHHLATVKLKLQPPWTVAVREQRRRRRRRSLPPSRFSRHEGGRRVWEWNPNSGERICTATCQHLIGQSNWSALVNWSSGQSQQSTLVKTANIVKWEGQNWKLDRN